MILELPLRVAKLPYPEHCRNVRRHFANNHSKGDQLSKHGTGAILDGRQMPASAEPGAAIAMDHLRTGQKSQDSSELALQVSKGKTSHTLPTLSRLVDRQNILDLHRFVRNTILRGTHTNNGEQGGMSQDHWDPRYLRHGSQASRSRNFH